MQWNKKGLIFEPKKGFTRGGSHAQIPVADKIDEQELRIYFSTRDAQGRSYPVYIEVDADDPKKILRVCEDPLLPLGEAGTFDDSGIMPFCVVNNARTKYLYYVGWSRAVTVPYHQAIGLAVSEDGGQSYRKFSEGPICDRCTAEPYFNTAPFVIIDDVWKMWYVSCSGWNLIDGRFEPYYRVKYAESTDGVRWERRGQVCIDYDEFTDAIGRPFVLLEDGQFRMLYSFRSAKDYRTDPGQSYRIGYAESSDGICWVRKDDEAGITRSQSGWDSKMLAYCSVYENNGRKYLLYNGNGFGQSGFGYAVSA